MPINSGATLVLSGVIKLVIETFAVFGRGDVDEDRTLSVLLSIMMHSISEKSVEVHPTL